MKGLAYKGVKQIKIGDNMKYKQSNARSNRNLGLNCNSRACLRSKIRKCNVVSEQQRKQLFQQFLNTMDWGQRKVFVKGLIDVKGKGRATTENSRRNFTFKNYLPAENSHEKITVCKKMFLSTFGLKETQVRGMILDAENGLPTKGNKKEKPILRELSAGRVIARDFLEGIYHNTVT